MTNPRPLFPLPLATLLCALTLACAGPAIAADRNIDAPLPAEQLPPGTHVTGLAVEPESVTLRDRTEYAQLLVTATLDTGDQIDVTRLADLTLENDKLAKLDHHMLLRPVANGKTSLKIALGEHKQSIPVSVANVATPLEPNYIRDVMPVLSRLGCNQGTCHGSKDGKKGFKLSLRGYDPIMDVRSLTDDHAGRRVNFAAPDQSLMLLKATGAVPHEGQQVTTANSLHHEIIRAWIARGAPLDMETPRVTSITLSPQNPTVQRIGSMQQFRVTATYADGFTRDVTAESFIETGDMEIATTDKRGLLTTLRRGEAPVLARFEGRYAATTLTVMGDRSGFEWTEPEQWNEIDGFVAKKWQRLKILPAPLCDDATFLRRIHLDLTGLPPTSEQVTAFLADKTPLREKRNAIIDELIGNEDFVEYWANKWADLLQVNRKFLAPAGAKLFRDWIRKEVAANTPYDEFAHKILTATGSNRENPPAAYYKILRTPEDTMENTTHLFLATRFNCNKCHDHPFERWTQDQYYEMAAFFARTGLKKDPAGGNGQIGKTAVEAGKPMYEIVYDKADGEQKHDRTGQMTAPAFPFTAEHNAKGDEGKDPSRRQRLAAWITSPDNEYFASSMANRLWGYMTGTGIIEPLDDIRAGNPASNPELLEWLTTQFVDGDFDTRKLLRTICQSRTYQLSIDTGKWNEDDSRNYSHAKARRLPAEVLYDTIMRVTGSQSKIPGVPVGTRAAALPDSGVKLPDNFLGNLGRPVRESACECERSTGLQLGPVMALVSGPTLNDAISDPNNAIRKLVDTTKEDAVLVDKLFLRILNRPPTDAERNTATGFFTSLDGEHDKLIKLRESVVAKHEPAFAKRDAERNQAIAAAKKTRTDYLAKTKAKRDADNAARNKRIKDVEGALAAFKKDIPARMPAFEKAITERKPPVWTPAFASGTGGSMKAVLTPDASGALFVSGRSAKGSYEITSFLPAEKNKLVTGVRVEALRHDNLPGKGPGRAQNGNFVLSEFQLHALPLPDLPKSRIRHWSFRHHTDVAAWAVNDQVHLIARSAGALARSSENDPNLTTVIQAPKGSYVLMVRAKFKGTVAAEVFWSTEKDTGYDQKRSAKQTWTGAEHIATYFIPFTADSPINGLRFDPMDKKASMLIESIEVHRGGKPKLSKQPLQNPVATFNQGNYDVPRSIDGNNGTGWAIAGGTGKDQTATYELKTDLDNSHGLAMRFELLFNHDTTHNLGHFRISTTTAQRPFGEGLPAEIAKALETESGERDDKMNKELRAYFEKTDSASLKLAGALAKAKTPLPADPELQKLDAALASAETPLKLHPRVVELNRARDLSTKQLQQKRLTAAQDISWALMNNPSFLFTN